MTKIFQQLLADFSRQLKTITKKQWQIAAICVGSVLVVLILFFTQVPHIQKNIRESQLALAVYPEKTSKKTPFIGYDQLPATLKKEKALTIVFLPTNGKFAKEATDMLTDDKATEKLNHQVYLYPMVYNTGEESKTYDIDYRYTTVVFFENGKEENRLILKKDSDFKDFITKLNALPMENIKELD